MGEPKRREVAVLICESRQTLYDDSKFFDDEREGFTKEDEVRVAARGLDDCLCDESLTYSVT